MNSDNATGHEGLSVQPHARVKQILAAADEAVRTEVLERLPGVIRELDDDLFNQADRAANHNEQNQLFDARREFRRNSRAFLQAFESCLDGRLKGFVRGEEPEMMTIAGKGELSLIDEEKLEVMLTINSIVDRIEGRELRRIHALNTRLSTLRPELTVTNENNPYSVRAFCECITHSADKFEVSAPHKVQLFQHFERHALNHFGELMETLNQQLIDAGILPNLEFSIARNEGSEEEEAEQQTAESADDAESATSDEDWNATVPPEYQGGAAPRTHSEVASNEALRELRELLAVNRSRSPNAQASSRAAGPAPAMASQGDLRSALSSMQQAARVEDKSPPPSALKDHLLDALGQASGENTALSGEQTDTVELVGMLFQYIQRESELHKQVQDLVSRLQVPLLRVALEDGGFFTEHTHPARQLLNTIAHEGNEWLSDDDSDSPVFSRLNKVTDRVLTEFRDDISVFKQLLTDLRDQLNTLKKRAEVNERRQIEASKGREKLELARERADKEIRLRLARAKPPEYIRGLLEEAWADVLALTVLRHGNHSSELKAALDSADDLIDCSVVDHSPERMAALRRRVPELLTEVRRGLAQVGFQGNDFDTIERSLKQLFSNALDEPTTADGEAAPREPEPARVRFGLSTHKERTKRTRGESIRLNEKEQAALSRLRKMQFGTWFEFQVDNRRRPIRWKLAWYSPVTSRCLFVNRRGARVDERSLQSLAREVARGKARLYRPDEAPLFDRAVSAILTRVRHMIQPKQTA